MALFFPKELATTVEVFGDEVVITQYDENECAVELGQVTLTKHQFEEMLNHSKNLFSSPQG